MANVDPELIAEINELAAERLRLEAWLEAENSAFNKTQLDASVVHDAVISPIKQAIGDVDAKLWRLIVAHEESLISGKLKSFTTIVAKFNFRTPEKKMKVTNKKAVITLARALRVLRKMAKMKVTWELDEDKFFAALPKLPAPMRKKFDPFIATVGGEENRTLRVTQNATYPVTHDDTRLTGFSVLLAKPSDLES